MNVFDYFEKIRQNIANKDYTDLEWELNELLPSIPTSSIRIKSNKLFHRARPQKPNTDMIPFPRLDQISNVPDRKKGKIRDKQGLCPVKIRVTYRPKSRYFETNLFLSEVKYNDAEF